MAFRDHRPNRQLGRSERPLIKMTKDLTSFLHKAQRSLAYDTLHLSSQQRSLVAHILVEFAEDLYQEIGIWRSLERYNLDFFNTPLPCVLQPDEPMDALPVNPERVQFLLWNLYGELEPELILSPDHQDLERLAFMITEFFIERFARLHVDSDVKRFLSTPDEYGWEVKRKLVWLGQHSYLFRLNCANYVQENGGKYDIPTLDDFVCQETTHWSGLGVIDILASTLDMTESQRRDLRSWYERHAGYFRIVSIHEPFMEVVNILNEQSYTVRVDENASVFEPYEMMFGSLVPWDGEWYWSGTQQGFETVPEDVIEEIKQDFPVRAAQIVYRYDKRSVRQKQENSSGSILRTFSTTMATIWSSTRTAKRWLKMSRNVVSTSLTRLPRRRLKRSSRGITFLSRLPNSTGILTFWHAMMASASISTPKKVRKS